MLFFYKVKYCSFCVFHECVYSFVYSIPMGLLPLGRLFSAVLYVKTLRVKVLRLRLKAKVWELYYLLSGCNHEVWLKSKQG